MKGKEMHQKKSKPLTREVFPVKQSISRLINKPKEKSSSSAPLLETKSNERERSSHFVSSLPHNLNVRIQARAYELYERRGGHHGQDVEDWMEAERQILSENL